jgi:hypothetical protein
MHEQYNIDGTSNLDPRELEGPEYNDPHFYPEFQQKLNWFKNTILSKYKDNKPYVVMRIFDGEFYFLSGMKVGNVGSRHCSKDLTSNFLKQFKDGCYKVDILSTQLYADKLQHYNSLFPDKPFDIPMEIIYGLFANKWLFNNFKNEIGIIGGEEKIKVIEELMKHSQYRDYLGIDYFTDYISVPERFSSDEPDNLVKHIGEQLSNSKAKIFLYGIGISKMAISYKFPTYKNAIYIDVGCGISALAGTTSVRRPYFGNWTNFRLKDYNYSQMDQMDFRETGYLNCKFL